MRDRLYEQKRDPENCWYKGFCNKFGTDECPATDIHSSCRKFTQTEYLLCLSNLPESCWKPIRMISDYLDPEVDDTIQAVCADCEFFVKQGYNLYLWGETGCGKTSWAIKIMLNYFAVIAEKNDFTPRGLYINVASFLRDAKLHMTYPSEDYLELLKTIQQCDIVLWDDVGQTNPSNYESQWLYSFINERLLAKKCNIFTSNLSPEQLETVDKRLESRICKGSDCLHITGPDMRNTKTYTEFMNSNEVIVDGTSSDT